MVLFCRIRNGPRDTLREPLFHFLKVAAGIFSKYGIDIAVATCGEDSIRKMENEKYDLVLMDMVMPDMSGSEVLKVIRAK